MNLNDMYQDMGDFEYDHPYLCELFERQGEPIYKEIVLFLNDFNPDWRMNKELGEYAPEFILDIMNEFKEFKEEEEENDEANYTKKDFISWLTEIYEDIGGNYNSTKFSYQRARTASDTPKEYKAFREQYMEEAYVDVTDEEEVVNFYQKYIKEDDESVYLFF
jgi:hypothetical protein